MNLSYWEIKSWLTNVDFTIIGSGIVGLNCAISLSRKYPKAKILILEKGMMPQGASTKNAGFACFGSLSELIDDLGTHSEAEVIELVEKRWEGLQLLREMLGDKTIGFKAFGGYELFAETENDLFETCLSQKEHINSLLHPIFKAEVFETRPNSFHFENIKDTYSFNAFEGQIDTGKLMEALLLKTASAGVKILNDCRVKSFAEDNAGVHVHTEHFDFKTKKLLIATNGFAQHFNISEVKPARAQVLITKPIENLSIKGTFHLEKGYYYFRNIDNRILLGGGRHLDFKTEETTAFGETEIIQNKLETLLKTVILPKQNFEIDHRWSGIMGVGNQKKAIVKQMSNNVFCGVRLGGMGIAIGSLIGKELAELT
ncbi:FAD-binding oxidoreductase [Subsaximicrobium wynnwilliamsii]|uniref:FAD-binding oxidoreductase n=1 Tax=Subsaximicrobium wynnwilliamsii TaxID=291179 RepID=A0A5C6ZFI0_9FLAO|nr:FAD-dependent oxidoreductase [Subsaximicrobium wynnwilliamsii]TXD82648.1 FAD-binding oxidoreductase [Subsaximicrobium wynnwilliamsii]TXD88383.1 FAD-binding oxidoreductase [Subsaximicrobium wynnwilliamsii]TXE02310.1 FAD-binding oxidoreductase [Subsaximicrobium wynnwilliamsii]